MKTKFLILLTLILMTGITISCSKDDDNVNVQVPSAVTSAFQKSYPNISPKWEYENPYYVAEFKYNSDETEVWYNPDGSWMMTVTDIPSTKLPAAITQAIAASKYASWKYDDVKLIDREGFEQLYKVEMEGAGTDNEVTLYYAENGTLIKEIPDIDNNTTVKPIVIPQKIQSYLDQNFPSSQYKVIDLDIDDTTGNYEVEVIKGTQSTEVVFSQQQEFLYSEYEIEWSAVPTAVQNSFNASGYTQNQIDDIYNRTTADKQTLYVFDLDINNKDILLIYDTEGNKIN